MLEIDTSRGAIVIGNNVVENITKNIAAVRIWTPPKAYVLMAFGVFGG